jgi:PadR family transcriptional regulator PadR
MSETWTTQLRKGLVEFCVLAVLAEGEAYGYAVVKNLEQRPGLVFKESSVYLVLGRLAKEQLVSVRTLPSPSGPKRRYYKLTSKGKRKLKIMSSGWDEVVNSINGLVRKEIL